MYFCSQLDSHCLFSSVKQDDSTEPEKADFSCMEKTKIDGPNYIPITSWKEIERRKTRHAIFQYALGK